MEAIKTFKSGQKQTPREKSSMLEGKAVMHGEVVC